MIFVYGYVDKLEKERKNQSVFNIHHRTFSTFFSCIKPSRNRLYRCADNGSKWVADSKGRAMGAAAPYWLKFLLQQAAFSRIKGILFVVLICDKSRRGCIPPFQYFWIIHWKQQ